MGFWKILQQAVVQVIYHLYRNWTHILLDTCRWDPGKLPLFWEPQQGHVYVVFTSHSVQFSNLKFSIESNVLCLIATHENQLLFAALF